MDQEKIYRNLVKLFKLFSNRPNHLAKYMIDNVAFNDFFLKLVENSQKLEEIENIPSFKAIQEMNDFFNLMEDFSTKKSSSKTIEELNQKLNEYLELEKYEDAIRIRDYINKLNSKNE